MGNMFAPHLPGRATPTPPSATDPAIQAAERAAAVNTGNMYGRQQTLLTSGAGDTAAAPVAKKTLLGG